jgi:MSHA biogenesis protein MshO
MHSPTPQRGFTLIELIMVIVILGVVGSMVAVFMKNPIDAYFASARRAALTDVADTVVRRMARDVRRALPNSMRQNDPSCIEFIPTKTGGRYRTQDKVALPPDDTSLDFSKADTKFNMLGDHASFAGGTVPPDQQIQSGDLIVVYNLGIPGASAYDVPAINWTTVRTAPTPLTDPTYGTETVISLPVSGFKFPLESGGNRFHVVASKEQMVSYVCDSGSSTLYRVVSDLPLTPDVQCTFAPSSPKIAQKVDCAKTSFAITDSGNALNRNALVSMRLTVTDSGETVSLYHEMHVDNTP